MLHCCFESKIKAIIENQSEMIGYEDALHRRSHCCDAKDRPLMKSVYDWKICYILPAVLSDPLMKVGFDLVEDKSVDPSITGELEDGTPEDHTESILQRTIFAQALTFSMNEQESGLISPRRHSTIRRPNTDLQFRQGMADAMKWHLNRGNKVINIKCTAGLAKRVINCIIIAKTNFYRIVVVKASISTPTDAEISFQSADAWQTAYIHDRSSRSVVVLSWFLSDLGHAGLEIYAIFRLVPQIGGHRSSDESGMTVSLIYGDRLLGFERRQSFHQPVLYIRWKVRSRLTACANLFLSCFV